MANLSSFPGNHEIIEIEEELNPGEQNRSNNYMKPELKREEKDRISSLEEDLNQLFEIFNRRSSSNGLAHTNQAGTTSKKSASKKLVKAGGPHSPGHGISERVNLKQALRGLCLSQKSEMAAMKRSAKTPGSSEAGKIVTLYRNVVDEDCMSNHSQDDGRGGLLEISLVPEESTFDSFRNKHTQWSPTKLGSDSFRNTPKNLPVPDMWPSNRSSLADRVKPNTTPNETVFESRLEKPVSVTSSPSPHVDDNVADMDHSLLNQSRMIRASAEVGNQASVTEMRQKQKHPLLPPSSSPTTTTQWSPTKVGSATVKNGTREIAKSSMTKNGEFPLSTEFASQTSLTDSLQKEKCMSPSASQPNYSEPSFEFARKMPVQKEMISVGSGSQISKVSLEMIPTSVGSGNQTKVEMLLHEDELEPACSPCTGKLDKIEPEESALRAVKKDSSKILPPTGSPKGKKVNKSMKNSYHFVKPLIKTKNFVKRKSKKISSDNNSSKNKRSEFNNDLYSSPNPVVCPNCQCVVTDAWKEANQESQVSHQGSLGSDQESPVSLHESLVSYQDSPVSPFASFSAEVSSGNVISDVSTPGPSSESLNKKSKEVVVAEARGNSKTRVKGEFTQSSKDSPGECSTSTSEESIISRPSFCDRPHMSKDVRWEAIRCVRFQHGTIGLRNFNLLKKLGCGDIGTVYLAELIGTNCHFAIKVMDNEFLVRRKKIARAQTEREILRMLDHPFLPTLYCQFISDNLSCLVMEYCPGGDLHVLRQRQPGRCFTEQAARFYLAEVLLALEYLHMLGVIYRDLKPENILVREDGHIMLSDFDLSLRCVVSPTLLVSSSMSETSKKVSRPSSDSRCVQPLCIEPSCQVTCFTPRLLATSSKLRKQKSDAAAEMRPLLQLVAEPTTARSNSFVGTHEYLAPEIIKGEGHGSAVDWWTFGIFLYELLYGRTPFKGAGNEETLANVVLQSLKFPDSPLVSLQARDLITALLVKEPENRLGTERGAAEIKQHPFFDGLNWALIRCTVPPELPEHRSYGLPQVGTGSGEHLEFEVSQVQGLDHYADMSATLARTQTCCRILPCNSLQLSSLWSSELKSLCNYWKTIDGKIPRKRIVWFKLRPEHEPEPKPSPFQSFVQHTLLRHLFLAVG